MHCRKKHLGTNHIDKNSKLLQEQALSHTKDNYTQTLQVQYTQKRKRPLTEIGIQQKGTGRDVKEKFGFLHRKRK